MSHRCNVFLVLPGWFSTATAAVLACVLGILLAAAPVRAQGAAAGASAPDGCCYCRQCASPAPICYDARDASDCLTVCRASDCQSLVFGFQQSCSNGCGGMPAVAPKGAK